MTPQPPTDASIRNVLQRAGFSAADLASGNLLCPLPPKTDVKGRWIWLPDPAGRDWRNCYAYFRRTFTAAGELTLHIAADTTYELHLDGALVERGTAPAEISYKTFDTHRLKVGSGRHVLAILVHHLGQQCATAMRSRPGLWVEMTGAESDPVLSDASWKTLRATAYQQWLPCMMSHFGFYEVCDHAQIPAGWTTTEFDDSAWQNAEVITAAGNPPWTRLIPRDIPALATTFIPAASIPTRGSYQPGPIPETEKDLTVAVEMAARLRQKETSAPPLAFPLTLAAGTVGEFAVIDFGRMVTGHIRLEFAGAKAGQKVDIGHDEILDANGLPNPRRLYVHAADRAYLRADQRELTIFGGRGFRYLMIDVATGHGGLTLTGVAVAERTYPVPRTGTFRSSDPAFEHLYQVGLTTTRLCMLDTFVDCPTRERVLWMDMAVEAHCSVYGFGDTALWRRCLYLFAQNPAREGAVAGAIKGFVPCDYDPMLVSYTLYYLLSVADYHHYSGDLKTCAALFPTLMKQLEVVAQFTTPEGLLNEKWPGWGTFLDWSAMDFGGVSSCNNAIYIRAHRDTARLARALGEEDTARRLEEKAATLATAYHRAFWSADEKLFVDALYDGKPSAVRSQLASVMAIWAGLVPATEARALLARIMDESRLLPFTACNYRLKPGFKCQTGGLVRIGTPGSGYLLVQVLFEHGLAREALDYLKANWLPIARQGTYCEHFGNDYDISYCHGWGAGAVVQLPAYVLGIRPVAPGWKEIEIVPQRAGLDWAEGSVPTPHGDIRVAWRMDNGVPRLDYQVPPGIKVVRAAFT
ncbi:MAG: family 78 glycoside hydrolase catalytic domain [Opitutaceae bacterium]|nr:family 78 glycoside hydrolase catalytic domain [Opitutaceae bacterium]